MNDLEATLARAVAAGASRVGDVRDMGTHGRVGWIEDLEYNIVQFFEPARDRLSS